MLTIIIKWFNPSGELKAVEYGGTGVVSLYSPDFQGTGMVQALYLDKHHEFTQEQAGSYPSDAPDIVAVKEIPVPISFLVIPESPIGLIALLGSAFGALGLYSLKYRR